MSFVMFGNKDTLVTPLLYPQESPVSQTIRYTHLSNDVFYSPHGFAYPISYDTVPLHVAADNLYPVISDTLENYFPIKIYILIDHRGYVWRTVIQPDQDNNQVISYSLIHCPQGWWVTTGNSSSKKSLADVELKNTLMGFLYNNPPRKTIDTFWEKHFMGQQLQWLNIPQIVARLNNDFPKDPEKEKRRRSSNRQKDKAVKDLDQMIAEAEARM